MVCLQLYYILYFRIVQVTDGYRCPYCPFYEQKGLKGLMTEEDEIYSLAAMPGWLYLDPEDGDIGVTILRCSTVQYSTVQYHSQDRAGVPGLCTCWTVDPGWGTSILQYIIVTAAAVTSRNRMSTGFALPTSKMKKNMFEDKQDFS